MGHITIDEQGAGVSQSGVVILYGKSAFQNVPAGVFGRWAHTAVKEEVEDACRAALMHKFVRDLLNGYDTLLGGACGVESGGQKRRLAIAGAQLRNPSVLILGTICFSVNLFFLTNSFSFRRVDFRAERYLAHSCI